MFGKSALVSVFILFSTNFEVNFASPPECDFFSSKPVPYETPSPININSKEAIRVRVNSSVILKNALLTPFTVVNTGYALEGHGYPFERKLITTFGGVLCGQTYLFHQVRFYVSDDPKISSFTQINGKGSPLTLNIIYYKEAYGTFNKSLNYRDGVVMLTFQLDFSIVDNPLFYPVQLLLKLIREPGAQVTLPAVLVYAWFDRLPVLFGYYAYYDSYIDLVTEKQYPCAINILADRTVYVLSELQFYDSFTLLKNTRGEKLINRQPIQKRGSRPVYYGKGLGGIFPLF